MTDKKIEQYIEKVYADIEKYKSSEPGYYRTFNYTELLKLLNNLLQKTEPYDKRASELAQIKKKYGLTRFYNYNNTAAGRQSYKKSNQTETNICQNCGYEQEVLEYNEQGVPYCSQCFFVMSSFHNKSSKPNKIEDQSKKCQKKISEFQGILPIPYFVANYFNLLLLRDYLRFPKQPSPQKQIQQQTEQNFQDEEPEIDTSVSNGSNTDTTSNIDTTTNADTSSNVDASNIDTISNSSSKLSKLGFQYVTSDKKDNLFSVEIEFPIQFKVFYKKNKHIENPLTNQLIKQCIPWSEIQLNDIKPEQIPKKLYMIDLNIHQLQKLLQESRSYMNTNLPLGCQYIPSDNCYMQSIYRQYKNIPSTVQFTKQHIDLIEKLYLKFVDNQKKKQVQTGERCNLMIIQQFIHQINIVFKLQPGLNDFFKGKDINQNIIEFVMGEHQNYI